VTIPLVIISLPGFLGGVPYVIVLVVKYIPLNMQICALEEASSLGGWPGFPSCRGARFCATSDYYYGKGCVKTTGWEFPLNNFDTSSLWGQYLV
jgi:hypothetical protein